MTRQYDAIVVGAGVIGLFTARALRRSGRRVLVLDKGKPGAESSRAGGGILSPLQPWRESAFVQSLATASQQQYPGIARHLLQTTGIDVEYVRCGALYLESEHHDALDRWAAARDVPIERLTAEQLAQCEPAAVTRAARRLPDTAQIRNPRLLDALQAEAHMIGVEVRSDTQVRAVNVRAQQVTGVSTADGDWRAPVVVVAAGAWSTEILRPLGVDPGVYPARGQMLWYAPFAGSPRHLILGDEVYVIPRRDGICLAGSTVEDAGFEKVTTPAARTKIARRAAALVPALAGRTPAGQWCGLRPALRGDSPRVGAAGAIAGLFTNLGHFRNGITLAPQSAQVVLQQVALRGRSKGNPL